ncbi:MAG: tetratricopeptide repeat protein [Verrucomicrobia bacterium]|nr:tetratricopeptide repeat protein [Verrucomicrobiota bacterium]
MKSPDIARRFLVATALTAIATAPCFAQAPAPAPAPAPPAAPAAPAGPVSRATLIRLSEEADAAFSSKDYATAAGKLEELITAMGPNPSAAPAEVEQIYFNLGLAHFLGQRPAEAETAFTKCLAKFPKGEYAGRCSLGIGRACIAQGKDKFDTAIKALQRAKEDRTLRSEACLALGQVLADSGKRKEALEELRALMGADIRTPEQTTAAVEVIGLLADNADLDDLVLYLDRLINQAGVRDALSWYVNQVIVRGDEAVGARAYETALAIYQSIPTRAQILEVQGAALEEKRKTLKAMETKIAAEKTKPAEQRSPRLASQAASLKESIATSTSAMEAIEKKTDLDAALLMRRGRCLYYLKRHEEALLCFRTLRTKHASAPDAKSASYAEIIIYSELRDYKKLQDLCNAYLKAFPDADNSEQVASLAGELLVQDAKWPEVGRFYKGLTEKFPKSENLDRFIFFQAAAYFYEADFDAAKPLLEKFVKDYPNSQLIETAMYYMAMIHFLGNKYQETLASCKAYLNKFPDGRYAGDMQYRLSFIDYNDKEEDQSAKIIRELQAFMKEHPGDAAEGSMFCLLADVYKKTGKEDEALAAYRKAVWTESPDDVIQYALDTATSILQGRKDWAGIGNLHAEFLKKYPNSPLAMLSATWVARMKTREGKQDEAMTLLAESLKTNIANPASDQVEFLIDELVKVSVPKKKVSQIDIKEVDAKLVDGLKKIGAEDSPTSNARLYYARSRLSQLLKRPDMSDLYLKGIAASCKDDPSVLSPALLSLCGDILLKTGQLDDAERMFKRLADRYQDSVFSDAGPTGLGEVALARKQPEDALRIFNDVLTNSAGSSKFKEATLGKLAALVELGKEKEAHQLAQETIGDKSFRGEFAGKAYLLEARMYRKQASKAAGDEAAEFLKQAHAIYQRVYVSHQGFPEVCANAYWGAYEVALELKDDTLAQNTLKALAEHPKLQNTAPCAKAKETLK